MEKRKKFEVKIEFSDQGSYFYRINGGRLIPIKNGEKFYTYNDEIIQIEGLPPGVDYVIALKELERDAKETEELQEQMRKLKKKKKKDDTDEQSHWIKEILYYVCIVLVLVGMYIIQMDTTRGPKIIGGFSAYIVLSGSMQDEIPKDSFIISRQTDPNTLEIGDDITFMMDVNKVVTHRIIGINEDYDGNGKRAFETKGIMNKEKDEGSVVEDNIVGKVIFHSYPLGVTILWIRSNWFIILMWILIIYGLKQYYKKNRKET